MKRMISTITLVLIAFSFSIFSQVKPLDKTEFYSLIGTATKKRFDSSRREITKLKVYSKGTLESSTEEIEEFLIPGKQRYVLTEKSNDKSRKIELIKIGTAYYQRKDDGQWTEEKSWNRGGSMMGIPPPISSSYTVEKTTINNQPVQLYRFYAVYNEYKPKEGEEKENYWEQKTWVDKKGFEVRQEIIVGRPKSKEIISQRTYEYDYNLKNLKIEAPIK